jgi:hypothetical protein
MITNFSKLFSASELRVAAALFGIYTQVVWKIGGGFILLAYVI